MSVTKTSLTVQHVRNWIKLIETVVQEGDSERAHSIEDSLYEMVLREISIGGKKNASRLASAALESKKIEFTRHCS